MLYNITRNFFILIIAIYAFYKLLNIGPKTHEKYIALILFSISFSILSASLFDNIQSLNWMFIILTLFLIMKFVTQLRFGIVYTTTLLSFVLSFTTFSVSGIIIGICLLPIYHENYTIPWLVIRFGVGILQFALIYCCFKIPRLKKGMTFLFHISSVNIASTFCVLIIIVIIMFCQVQTAIESFMICFCSMALICILLLLYWCNYHLTQTYRKYLKENEIATLKALLLEKETQIEYFKTENDKLSRLIHKDNKMLPALSMAVTDFLRKAPTLSLPELDKLGSDLQIQLETLYDDRLKILTSYEKNLLPISSTGFSSVDAILIFMQKKARSLNIEYQFILSDPPSAIIPSIISEKDFSHLLSDLLDNAIIAAKDLPSGSIQIHMGYFDNIYTLKIFNTGSSFPIEVLQDLGINRHTTHKDSGGSGIGLMDIWKIKEACSATLLIDEVTTSSSGIASTTINILFNKKKHFIIHTDRYKELVNSLNRPDVMILPKE